MKGKREPERIRQLFLPFYESQAAVSTLLYTELYCKNTYHLYTFVRHHIFGQRHKPTLKQVYLLSIAPPGSHMKRPTSIAISLSTAKIRCLLKYEAAANDPDTGRAEEVVTLMTESKAQGHREKTASRTP